ncbi:DUF3592 domain-containing protein [Kribbella speibonae]|uniref:DUF3592 domain-containing protein n=1 Tax=Kribbella speibonae TaxID=1572660 RepID=A0A4R0IR31_9ACTN|nr:DUF3592 domain-containing protein [Kribbella speibonae]TCC27604.1 DUF3592 domain-containing protein [Kribbella speibonae]TCC35529.1 DUF3592 domain-containing protein [Kribbella speibonae]
MTTQPYQPFQPESRRRPDRKLQAIMTLGAAVVLFVFGYYEWHEVEVLKHRGVVVEATIDHVKTGKRARITVSYTTRDGEPVTAKTSYSTTPEAVGDKIRVVYDPQKPTRMQVVGELDYLETYVAVGFGAILCLAALVLALWPRGPSNQASPQVSPYPW